jgi:glycosyltransferase involved in cell wall biosynthesis
LDSENEKQYGRGRSYRKPTAPRKPDEPAEKEEKKSKFQEQKPEEKSPQQILNILEAEKEKDKESPREKSGAPETRQRPRGGRPRKPKSEGRGKPDRSRSISKRPSRERTGKPSSGGFLKLSVVIPAYNEEGNVEELLSQFDQVFRNLPYKSEMIFVDDGSTDRTLVKAKDSQGRYKWLKVYSHRSNMGLTAALETGFAKASGKIICFYPADMQYHANEIPKMVSKLDSGSDIVAGWKQGRYGLKSPGSFIYNKLSRWIFNVRVHDLNSIKAFKREVAGCFAYRKGWHRYMVVMAAQAGYRVDEVKVKLYPRKSGKSKFGFSQLPLGFLDLLSVKFELSFTKKPLLLFGSVGLIFGFLGLVIGLIAIYLRVVEHTGYRPLLYAVILLMVSGLLLFAIGFLAELMVSVKEELHKKRSV